MAAFNPKSSSVPSEWVWRERLYSWFFYNAVTVLFIASICVAQMLFGSLVRWEVGEIQYTKAVDPVATLSQGWSGYQCFDTPSSSPFKKICGFTW